MGDCAQKIGCHIKFSYIHQSPKNVSVPLQKIAGPLTLGSLFCLFFFLGNSKKCFCVATTFAKPLCNLNAIGSVERMWSHKSAVKQDSIFICIPDCKLSSGLV